MATDSAKPAAANPDDLFQDKGLRKARDKTLEHMKWGPIVGSIAKFFLAVGGPLLGGGLLAVAGGMPALVTVGPILAITGAALTAIGIAIDYSGTRMWQAASLDQTEVSAQCNARHLVQELKASHVSMTFEQNARGDGRTWVQATGRGGNELQQQF